MSLHMHPSLKGQYNMMFKASIYSARCALLLHVNSLKDAIKSYTHMQYLPIFLITNNESSSWRLLMPLGMFCFAQKCYKRVVNEQIEFHVLQKSLTKTEVYGD